MRRNPLARCRSRPRRPGGAGHVVGDPLRAHKELHFRLLRHDMVAPLARAAALLHGAGGVAAVQQVGLP